MAPRNTGSGQRILEAALTLFSVNGFEATSMGEIAEAVGIRKASLYSHFTSKQEILDSLLEQMRERFERHSLPAHPENLPEAPTPEAVAELVMKQVDFLVHDPFISKTRRFLVLEQYRKPDFAAMQTKHAYTDVLAYHTALFRKMIGAGRLKPGDAEMVAAQFAFPVSEWIALIDREPEREAEALRLIRRHIASFFADHAAERDAGRTEALESEDGRKRSVKTEDETEKARISGA
ncbi:MAG: TetR/AcrR family transcriptional regulator [Clostridia bacterium]|nr:TetR/AcrR family transcriptional regulator [Clostridia bacterium]